MSYTFDVIVDNKRQDDVTVWADSFDEAVKLTFDQLNAPYKDSGNNPIPWVLKLTEILL